MTGDNHNAQVAESVDSDILSLTKRLSEINSNPTSLTKNIDDKQRLKFMRLARAAATALETEFDTLQRLAFSPLELVVTRIGQDRGIFSQLVDAAQPVTFEAIQESSKLNSDVLGDILNYLCANGMVQEISQGQYSTTALTHRLATTLLNDTVTHYHDSLLPGFASLNAVLGNPQQKLTAFDVGHRTTGGFYAWVESRPFLHGAFHRFMDAQFSSLPSWLEAVDFDKEFGQGLTDDGVAFVDVGGSIGHQCAALKNHFPHLKGRIILQDKPDVIAKALEVPGIETLSYDYLTPQPIQGSRVYYFRQIMHNNDNHTCVRILQSQMSAMTSDSVIVIDEKVLPDSTYGADMANVQYTASLSLLMKTVFDAQERRESSWRKLLTRAGLVVKEIRLFSVFHDAVIIAGLP